MLEEKKVYDFLNTEYKAYANYVIESRAIASCVDGLKITQRKILYAALKHARGEKVKVNVLAGMVIANCQYHHGDVSCCDSIINMAQKFKNNLPVLEDIGIYGSLRNPFASSARYISTKLSDIYKHLYKDESLLENNIVDGFSCEYKFFLPIIPMILVNGSDGIAVGFSMKVINRCPLDIINSCISYIKNGKIGEMSPKLTEFNGKFIKDEQVDKRWIIRGSFKRMGLNTIEINELVPSMTYEKYENLLDSLVDKKTIISYKNESREDIKYVLKFDKNSLSATTDTQLIKLLKLEEYKTEIFSTLDENGKLKIFESVEEILRYFVDFRMTYYIKRKSFNIDVLEKDISLLTNKMRFIKYILDGKLKINNVSKDKIVVDIEKLKIDRIEDSYDYLLRMPIYSLTKELFDTINDNIEKKRLELSEMLLIDHKMMYLSDLTDLKKIVSKI